MKIVIDTNVIVSGLLSPYGNPGEIVRMISSGELWLCFDARLLSEYNEVLRRPKFQFSEDKIIALIDLIEHQGLIIASSPLQQSLPDTDDNAFLEVAIAAHVQCLVTGNINHFPAKLCDSIRVISPAEYIKFYRKHKKNK